MCLQQTRVAGLRVAGPTRFAAAPYRAVHIDTIAPDKVAHGKEACHPWIARFRGAHASDALTADGCGSPNPTRSVGPRVNAANAAERVIPAVHERVDAAG